MARTMQETLDGGRATLKTAIDSRVVDQAGEILEESSVQETRVPGEPHFIKIYLKDICYLNGMSEIDSSVLFELLKYTKWGSNEIIINANIRKEICQRLYLQKVGREKPKPKVEESKAADSEKKKRPRLENAMQPNTLTKAIKRLKDADILHEKAVNTYIVNPYLFGRGAWTDVEKVRLSIEYGVGANADPKRCFKTVVKIKENPGENQG